MAIRIAPPTRLPYEEFLKADFGEQRVEWVDGEIDYTGTVSRAHGLLVGFLEGLIRNFVQAGNLGEVHSETFNLRLADRRSGSNPDVLVVLNEHMDRLKANVLDGPADLVIEVVRRDDPYRDTVRKVVEYERAGVPEYWIIDPERKNAVFLVLDSNAHYEEVESAEGVYNSTVLTGLWIETEWLFAEPLPPLMDVLREWKLLP